MTPRIPLRRTIRWTIAWWWWSLRVHVANVYGFPRETIGKAPPRRPGSTAH